jgi:two-component system, chemotaxis family, response regulator Rcp1
MVEVTEKAVKVFLVEDYLPDVKLMEKLLTKCSFPVHLRVARDGEEALKALRQSSSFGAKEDPDLVLLDLNIPKIDGREVLREIKTDPGLKHLPVLILSNSQNNRDLVLAQQNYADAYFVKPTEILEFADLIIKIENFWFKTKEEKET